MENDILNDFRENGWTHYSHEGELPYWHTVGLLVTCGHPEFIIFGLAPYNALVTVEALLRDMGKGKTYTESGIDTFNAPCEDDPSYRFGYRRVHPSQHARYLGVAKEFLKAVGCTRELEAVQLFWPDDNGIFPFEDGCDPRVIQQQPRLDVEFCP